MKRKLLTWCLCLALMMTCIPLASLAQSDAADTSEFVTVNLLVPGDPNENGFHLKVQDEWNKVFREKLNCEVVLNYITWNDWETRYNLMLLSGEGLDLVTVGTWLDLWGNITRGAFADLTDLLPAYAPGIWQDRSQDEWDQIKVDGKIHFVPQTRYDQWVDQGIMYRKDWAEAFGIALPITTWEGITEYFTKVKETYPDIIPFDTHNNRKENWWGWVQSHTDHALMEMVNTGFTNIFFSKSAEDMTVVCPVFEDTMLDFARMMKKWQDDGIYRKDVLNTTHDDWALFLEGRNGGWGRHTNSYLGDWKKFEEKNPGADMQMFAFADESGNLTYTDPANDGMAVSYFSKHPERALMVLDLIYSDPQLYRLMQYGIEGENYFINEDGLRCGYSVDGDYPFPDGVDKTYWSNMWGMRISAFEVPGTGRNPHYEEVVAHKESMAKLFPFVGFAFNAEPVQSELAQVAEIVNRYMPQITYGLAADAEKTVEDFRNALKSAGVDTVMDEIQKQLDAKYGK